MHVAHTYAAIRSVLTGFQLLRTEPLPFSAKLDMPQYRLLFRHPPAKMIETLARAFNVESASPLQIGDVTLTLIPVDEGTSLTITCL